MSSTTHYSNCDSTQYDIIMTVQARARSYTLAIFDVYNVVKILFDAHSDTTALAHLLRLDYLM
jgi:hypothetical protein